MEIEKIRIGEIVVDSGSFIIGDPCNLLHGQNPKLFGKDWNEFCELAETDYFQKGYQVKRNSIGASLAVDVRPGGDGRYPVYLEKNEHGFLRIIVEIG